MTGSAAVAGVEAGDGTGAASGGVDGAGDEAAVPGEDGRAPPSAVPAVPEAQPLRMSRAAATEARKPPRRPCMACVMTSVRCTGP